MAENRNSTKYNCNKSVNRSIVSHVVEACLHNMATFTFNRVILRTLDPYICSPMTIVMTPRGPAAVIVLVVTMGRDPGRRRAPSPVVILLARRLHRGLLFRCGMGLLFVDCSYGIQVSSSSISSQTFSPLSCCVYGLNNYHPITFVITPVHQGLNK